MLQIVPFQEEDYPRLTDLCYEVIFQPEGVEKLPRSIVYEPTIYQYIDGFGTKPDDHCLLAKIDGITVGGVWVRLLHGDLRGYGNIDANTPEFAIAILPHYRKKGIGTQLMQAMFTLLRNKGYTRASLSVQKDNYAAQWYSKLGFRVLDENIEDYIMQIDL